MYHGDDLHGVQHNSEMISSVCNIPGRISPQCASHRWDDLCTHHIDDLSGVQYTAEINCTPRQQNRILHLCMVAFKETIMRNPSRGEHIYQTIMKEKILSIKCWFIKKNVSSQWCAAHRSDHFVIEYLGEIETEFENTLACMFIRGPNGIESWTKWRSKILWHTPFKLTGLTIICICFLTFLNEN